MEKILSILKATPYITINELVEIVGISQKGAEWQMAKLKKEGRVKRIGPDKGGHWEVIKLKAKTQTSYNFLKKEGFYITFVVL